MESSSPASAQRGSVVVMSPSSVVAAEEPKRTVSINQRCNCRPFGLVVVIAVGLAMIVGNCMAIAMDQFTIDGTGWNTKIEGIGLDGTLQRLVLDSPPYKVTYTGGISHLHCQIKSPETGLIVVDEPRQAWANIRGLKDFEVPMLWGMVCYGFATLLMAILIIFQICRAFRASVMNDHRTEWRLSAILLAAFNLAAVGGSVGLHYQAADIGMHKFLDYLLYTQDAATMIEVKGADSFFFWLVLLMSGGGSILMILFSIRTCCSTICSGTWCSCSLADDDEEDQAVSSIHNVHVAVYDTPIEEPVKREPKTSIGAATGDTLDLRKELAVIQQTRERRDATIRSARPEWSRSNLPSEASGSPINPLTSPQPENDGKQQM